MAGIIENFSDDIKKLREVKKEIQDLKKELMSIDIRVNLDIKENIEQRLQALTKQYHTLAERIGQTEGQMIIAAKRANEAIKGVSADPLKSFDAEMLKMCNNLNKYFDELLAKIESMYSLLQVGKIGIDNPTSNNVPSQQLEELKAKNVELTEQLRSQKEEIKQQQKEWNSLANAIKTNNVDAIKQYQQANADSSTTVKEAKSELKGLTRDLDENLKYYDKLTKQAAAYADELTKLKDFKDKGGERVVVGDNGTSRLVNDVIEETQRLYEKVRDNQKGITSEITQQKKRQAELNTIIEQGSEKHLRTRTLIMDSREQLIQMRAAGLQNTAQYQQSAEELGKMRKQMVLVNAEMAYLSNPNKNLATFKAGLSGIASSASLVVGVMGLVNQKNEEMLQLQTKIQSLLGIIVGLEGSYNMVKKSSILMIAIENIQRKASIASQSLESKAKTANIALTWSEVAAQKAFNLVAKANPYLLLATAIATVVGGIYLYIKANKEAEKTSKAFKALSKENSEALMEIGKHTASSAATQIASFRKLQKEWINLGDKIKKQKKFIRDNQSEFNKLGIAISSVDDASKALVNNTGEFIGSLKKRALAAAYYKQIESDTEKLLQLEEETTHYNKRVYHKGDTFKMEIKSADDNYTGKLFDKLLGTGTTEILLDTDEKVAQAQEIEDKRALEEFRKTKEKNKQLNESKKAALEKRITDGLRSMTDATSEADAIIDNLSLKKYGKGDKKEESATEKLRKEQDKYKLLLDKQALDKKRSAEDLQMQVDETRIKAMQDGSKKTIAQMELDNKKEIQQLERQKEDYIRNAIQAEREKFEANPSNKGKSFNPSTVSVDASSFDSVITNTKARQKNDEIKEHQQAWENYLIEYGNFLQKKEALTVQYNAKINEASTQGEKESLKKELGTKLKELNFNELKDSLNFADVFGDLDSQTTTALTSLRDKLKEYINKAAKDLKPEDLKELQDAFKNIDFKIAERNPFEELKNGLEEYKDSCKEIEKAQNVLNATQQFGFTTVQQYDKETGKVTYSLITQKQAEKDLANAQSDRQKSLSKLTQSANSIGSKGMEVVNAGNQLVDMLGNLGVEIPEAVRETLDGVGQIMSGLERIDLTKPFSAVTGMIGVLSGVGNTIAGLLGFGNKANELTEEQIREYESLSDAMDKCIDRHKALMDELTNEEAVTEYEKTIELTKRKIEATKKIGEDYMNSNAKRSHTYGYKMRKDIEPYRAELAAIGIDLDSLGGRLENIFSLPVDKLKLLQETSAWATLDKQTQEYIQTLIDADEKVKELGDDLNENLTQTSFDSVFNNFLDMLTDMDSSSEDFAENFEEYMRNAILRSMLVKNYQGQIKEWYKKFSAANKDGIDDKEYEELKQEWNGIVSDAKRDTDALKDDFGWGSSSSQSSTRKSYETVSQDSIEETNGRLTAVQIAGEEIKAQSILQTGLLSSIDEKMSGIHLPDAENSVSIVNDIPSLEGLREIFASSMAQRDNSSGQLLEQVVLLKGEMMNMRNTLSQMEEKQAMWTMDFSTIAENSGVLAKNSPKILANSDEIKRNTNGLSSRR